MPLIIIYIILIKINQRKIIMNRWTIEWILIDIDKSINIVNNYCEEKKIKKSIDNFLFYEYNNNTRVGNNYNKLFLLSYYYLVGSKSFYQFYKKIDKDFKDDLLNKKEYMEYYTTIMNTPEIKNKLKEKLNDDFIGE